MTLTVGSLFSGIGGLDLGLERAGMNVIWQSEIDPYACRVLKKHWPEVPNHGDIKQIDWSRVERPAVICGGYPCQPFSVAGRRKGEQDSRHLWPYVRQSIRALRPDYAILENVPGHVSMGLDRVLADLTEDGFDAEWQIVSAAAQGAPHLRERLIIVAYPNHTGSGTPKRGSDTYREETKQKWQVFPFLGSDGCSPYVAYPHGEFMGKRGLAIATRQTSEGWDDYYRTEAANGSRQWWETEPDVGRVADGVPNRVDRLRGLGNAVVPQVAEVIGRLVVEHATHN
jgi:DNA (cytosine-5)-methyltransferase 1